jgi:hypothetical protein
VVLNPLHTPTPQQEVTATFWQLDIYGRIESWRREAPHNPSWGATLREVEHDGVSVAAWAWEHGPLSRRADDDDRATR